MDSKPVIPGHGSPEAYNRLLERADAALRRSADADELVECGALLFEPFHDDQKAREVLLRAATINAADGRPLFWLAKIAIHRSSDEALAREYLEQALAREPDRPESLALLVSLLLKAPDELNRCIQMSESLVRHASDWPMAYAIRAQVLEKVGLLTDAEQTLSRASELIDNPHAEAPDTYFEAAISGRRPSQALKGWILERLNTLRSHHDSHSA